MKKVLVISLDYSIFEAITQVFSGSDLALEFIHALLFDDFLTLKKPVADVVLVHEVEEWRGEYILRKLKSQPWWGGHTRAIGISAEPQPYVSEKFLGVHRLLESGIIGEGLRAELVALVSYP